MLLGALLNHELNERSPAMAAAGIEQAGKTKHLLTRELDNS